MDRKRVLITGVSGLLGNNLARYFRDKDEVLGLYYSHPVDIEGIQTDRADILAEGVFEKIIQNFRPLVVIHCVSLANVDQCEVDKKMAKELNVIGTRIVANSVNNENSTKLVYISSDLVYDGSKDAFSEADEARPLNWYGETKYEGEREAIKKKNSLVLRTNIFGWNIQEKESIGEWVLNRLKENANINGFKDAYFSSIYTFELAKAMDAAIQKDLKGIYNCASTDSCSKYEFALKIADAFGLDRKLITSMSIDDFAFKAKRAKRLILNVNKFQDEVNYRLPTMDQCIASFWRDYKQGLPHEIKHCLTPVK